MGIPVLGRADATPPRKGDTLWLDPHTLVVGRGFRTNAAGVVKLQALLGPLGVAVVSVDLPYDKGPDDLLHLQSVVSLLDRDLALVHRPLLPVPLFEMMQARGMRLLDVPPEEYPRLGGNVLALAPRRVLMVSGLPRTRARLEQAGCAATEFAGEEIARKGNGGPTCLTRPLRREAV